LEIDLDCVAQDLILKKTKPLSASFKGLPNGVVYFVAKLRLKSTAVCTPGQLINTCLSKIWKQFG
jgi:hypothetical protein